MQPALQLGLVILPVSLLLAANGAEPPARKRDSADLVAIARVGEVAMGKRWHSSQLEIDKVERVRGAEPGKAIRVEWPAERLGPEGKPLLRAGDKARVWLTKGSDGNWSILDHPQAVEVLEAGAPTDDDADTPAKKKARKKAKVKVIKKKKK